MPRCPSLQRSLMFITPMDQGSLGIRLSASGIPSRSRGIAKFYDRNFPRDHIGTLGKNRDFPWDVSVLKITETDEVHRDVLMSH